MNLFQKTFLCVCVFIIYFFKIYLFVVFVSPQEQKRKKYTRNETLKSRKYINKGPVV